MKERIGVRESNRGIQFQQQGRAEKRVKLKKKKQGKQVNKRKK